VPTKMIQLWLNSATVALCTLSLLPAFSNTAEARSDGMMKVQNLLSTTGRGRRIAAMNGPRTSAGAASAAKTALTNLEHLDSAANVLLAVADERLLPADACQIAVEHSYQLLNSLQSKIDGGTADYIRYKSKTHSALADASWPSSCEVGCHCGLYSAILESVGFEKLVDADRKIFRAVSSLAVNQTKEELTQCARKSTWFCSSTLKRELESDAANNQ
jgi:hypothetical protein